MAVPPILDQFGHPARSGLGSARLMESATSGSERPSYPLSLDSINRVVPAWDWRTIVSVSRRLYANMGVPRGAIDQKAKFSVGRAWDPTFKGADAEWGKLATEWLRDEWYSACNIRGSMYDFKTDLHLASISVDRDGDFGILLTEAETGYPLLQHIPAHRIGCRVNSISGGVVGADDARSFLPSEDGTRKEVRGLYAGLLIENGVIYNGYGRPVAFRILGTVPQDDLDVSARDFIHVFDPEWADQGRGFPAFSHACNDFRDMLQSQQWEQLAQLIASSIGMSEWNEAGAADPNDPGTVLGSNAAGEMTLTQETIQGGRIRYFKANGGGKIETFAPERPSEMWNQFWDRLTRSALAGIGWPYEMVWKSGDSNAANERSQQLRAQSSVDDRQDLLRGPARRMVGYAISKAMQLGILPQYTGKDKGGFLKWDFCMPPKLSIDKRIDADARREDYKLGTRNLSDILSEDGGTLDAHRSQRQREVVDVISRAQEIAKETGVEFTVALNLFEQRTPNPVTPPPPAAPKPVDTPAAA